MLRCCARRAVAAARTQAPWRGAAALSVGSGDPAGSCGCGGGRCGGGGDRIHLEGLVFHGYHGVLPEENVLGQKFVVDATLFCRDLRAAGASDQLGSTVNYADVAERIRAIVEGPPAQLLEAVAERIAGDVLRSYAGQVATVRVRVWKPHVAIPTPLARMGVDIMRSQPA